VIVSLTYTNVGNIANHQVFTHDFQTWLKAQSDFVLCRKDLFEALVS